MPKLCVSVCVSGRRGYLLGMMRVTSGAMPRGERSAHAAFRVLLILSTPFSSPIVKSKVTTASTLFCGVLLYSREIIRL